MTRIPARPLLDGAHIVHLLHVQSHPQADFRTAHIGLRLPALSTSGGLTMLSRLPELMLDSLLAGYVVEPVTPYTITDMGALRDEIRRARERGYAFTDQQSILG